MGAFWDPSLATDLRLLEVRNRVVIVRTDYNIPAASAEGEIADDWRIRVSLPTLEHLTAAGARVVVLTHRGRPQGQVVPGLSTRPLAERLSQLIGKPVAHAPDCVGRGVEQMIAELPAGHILMLENTRFHLGEQMNQQDFLKKLARLGDVFVNEAFPAFHRPHASISGMMAVMPECALGLRAIQELHWLDDVAAGAEPKLTLLLGGPVNSGQFELLNRMLDRMDTLMVAGAMASTFLAARDVNIGLSRYDPAYLEAARDFLAEAGVRGCRVLMPGDVMAHVPGTNAPQVRPATQLAPNEAAVDLGPQTRADWSQMATQAKTLVWLESLSQNETCQLANTDIATALGGHLTAQQPHLIGGDKLLPTLCRQGLTDILPRCSSGYGVLMAALSGQSLPAIQVLRARMRDGVLNRRQA